MGLFFILFLHHHIMFFLKINNHWTLIIRLFWSRVPTPTRSILFWFHTLWT
jgi:hypothetical protein